MGAGVLHVDAHGRGGGRGGAPAVGAVRQIRHLGQVERIAIVRIVDGRVHLRYLVYWELVKDILGLVKICYLNMKIK